MWSLMLKLSDGDFSAFIRNIKSLSLRMYINVVISFGLHICEQYISWDRTSVIYRFFFTSMQSVLKVLLINPRV